MFLVLCTTERKIGESLMNFEKEERKTYVIVMIEINIASLLCNR